MVRTNDRAGNRVMSRQGELHPLGVLLPKPPAALDIGEQKCGDAGRYLHGGQALRVSVGSERASAYHLPTRQFFTPAYAWRSRLVLAPTTQESSKREGPLLADS